MANPPRPRWAAFAVMLMAAIALEGCGGGTRSVQEVLTVRATSATSPWLGDVYACAPSGTAIAIADPDSAQLLIRLGEPPTLAEPAYQIGFDDLLVVVHPLTAIGHLTADQVAALFAGQIGNWRELGGADAAVHLWVFGASQDVQEDFDRLVLRGRPVSSLARVVFSAQDMSDSVGNTPGSAGLLPRRWKAGNTREAFSLPALPVLAIMPSTPRGSMQQLVSCLQSR
jgi:hypothetical protein